MDGSTDGNRRGGPLKLNFQISLLDIEFRQVVFFHQFDETTNTAHIENIVRGGLGNGRFAFF